MIGGGALATSQTARECLGELASLLSFTIKADASTGDLIN